MKKTMKAGRDTALMQWVNVLEAKPARVMRTEELGSILKHQMSAPLHMDLIGLDQDIAVKIKAMASEQGLLLKSFRDLLQHPNPPVELLTLAKDFAKACRLSRTSTLPHDVAAVLYFVCIVVARVKCAQRITTLNDEALAAGLSWTLRQPWLDEATRDLLIECMGTRKDRRTKRGRGRRVIGPRDQAFECAAPNSPMAPNSIQQHQAASHEDGSPSAGERKTSE